MRSLTELIKEFAKILDENNIDYAIAGGIALSFWGVDRIADDSAKKVKDIDVILNLRIEVIHSLVISLKKSSFSVNENDILAAQEDNMHFTIYDDMSSYIIDVKGVYNENDIQTLKNREKIILDDVAIHIVSAEDMIANKLLSGSREDRKDAEAIYLKQRGILDTKYLVKRCRELRVYNDLADMIMQIGDKII